MFKKSFKHRVKSFFPLKASFSARGVLQFKISVLDQIFSVIKMAAFQVKF